MAIPWPAFVIALAVVLISPTAAFAATYTVNDLGDATDALVGDGVCETVTGNGLCTLRAAIAEANFNVDADTVVVPAGTITLGAALSLSSAITVEGDSAATTIIDGNSAIRPFSVASSTTVTLKKLTVQHGLASGSGGAISTAGTLTLDAVFISSNEASGSGGGINSSGTLTIQNGSKITGNKASNGSGGGLMINTGLPTVLTDTEISSNQAIKGTSSGAYGGAISGSSNGRITLTRVTMTGNQAAYSGGGMNVNGPLTISNTTISGNTALDGSGGGINLGTTLTSTIVDSTISGNFAKLGVNGFANGAGLNTFSTGRVTLTRVTVSNNQADKTGGGVFSSAPLTVSNSSLTGNKALNGAGGGVGLNSDQSTSFTDTVISNNSTTLGSFNQAAGAGLNASSTGEITLTRVTVDGNQAGSNGGGISSQSPLTIVDSTITNNKALNGSGGGASILAADPSAITNTVIANNTTTLGAAGFASGAGLNITGAGAVTLTDVTVQGNESATNSAGIIVSNSSGPHAALTMIRGSIVGNKALGGNNGGISVSGVTSLTDVSIVGNTSSAVGGGVNVTRSGNATLNRVTISGNSGATGGGGLVVRGDATSAATASLTNVTISGNSGGTGDGGGARVQNDAAAVAPSLSLTHVTIAGNGASRGGGIYNGNGTVSIRSSIVADSTAGGDCFGALGSLGFNVIESTGGCVIGGTTTGDISGVDPALGPLQNNGGSTKTHSLGVGSVALDLEASGCPAPSEDQRGVVRAQGAACDAGAFESRRMSPGSAVFSINGGAVATTSVNVFGRSPDETALPGVVEMSFSQDGSAWTAWEPFALSRSWTLPNGTGLGTMHARYRNGAGTVIHTASDSITVDPTKGSDYSVSIANGDVYSRTTGVQLFLAARPKTTQMMISNDGGFGGAVWEPFNTEKAWTIINYGTYLISPTVYVRYRDENGAVVPGNVTDTIILDVNAPTGSVSRAAAASSVGAVSASVATPTLTLSATDDAGGSGVTHMRICDNAGFSGCSWQPYSTGANWGFASGRDVFVQFRDAAGNVSPTYSWPVASLGQPAPEPPDGRGGTSTGGKPGVPHRRP
ncbi:MAG: right-handed parallel beta-helix repeat-containing protein [Chloroflexota bacterium]